MLATATHLRLVPESPNQLEALFREHADRIYRTAYRVTGNTNDAEDVLQTVFLRLARRNTEIELKPNPQAYLLRAAINAALDIVRARTLNNLVPLEDIAPENLAVTRNPESLHSDREIRRLIQQEISQLSQKTAEMFILKYFEGYENKEIAQFLGTSHLVVGVMLHRARAQLRKKIEAVV